jgi:Holliday junction resolvase RusA-like endonuclease
VNLLKNVIEFEFLEPPKGKERPRLAVKNGKTFAFTPKTTRLYEKRLRDFVSKIMIENSVSRRVFFYCYRTLKIEYFDEKFVHNHT